MYESLLGYYNRSTPASPAQHARSDRASKDKQGNLLATACIFHDISATFVAAAYLKACGQLAYWTVGWLARSNIAVDGGGALI